MSRNSKTSPSPISGAPREKTFAVNYFSKAENRRYQGTFTAKRPTVMQSMQIEGIKSSLLDGKYYDPDNPGCGVPGGVAMMAELLSFLKVAIVNGPEWWEDGEGEFSDPQVLVEVYKEAQDVDPFRDRIEFVAQFGAESQPRSNDSSSGASSDDQHHEAHDDGGLAEMVDAQV